MQLTAVARLLTEHGGTKCCALPGCNKPVPFDAANPQQRIDYCGQDHARKSHLSLNNRDFVLTPAMRACNICGQRHLDRDCPAMRACAVCDQRHLARDCPRIMLSDPGALAASRRPATTGAAAAPATAAADNDTARPATPGATAPLPAAAHTAAVFAARPATHPFSRSPRGLPWLPAGDATSGAATPSATAAAAAHAAAATTAHPAAPGAAAASSDPDGPGAADAEAPPPGPRLLDHGPDTVAAAPPFRPPALSPRGRPWLPTGDAAPNAPLPAAAAIERRDARVARNYEEAVEHREAHVAQTYDALSLDGSEYAPHPRQRTTVHTAADNEWFTEARKERSVALYQIDALESRLHLARIHYHDLLRASADQKEFIAMRDARDDACRPLSSPPPSPPASPRCSLHDPAHPFHVDLNDDLEINCDIFHGTPSPLPPTWSPLNRLYCSIWHISHKAWNKAMHALHGNGFDISDLFLLVIIAALGYRLTVIGIHMLTACQRATDVFIRPAVTAATTYSIIDAITRLVTPPSISRAAPAFDTPPPPQETVTDHHGRDKPAGHRPP